MFYFTENIVGLNSFVELRAPTVRVSEDLLMENWKRNAIELKIIALILQNSR